MPPSANSRSESADRIASSRRHAPQISISDDNHHVTEAIGDMYGSDDEDWTTKRNSRPLSFIRSPGEVYQVGASPAYFDAMRRTPLARTASNERVPPHPVEDGHSIVPRKGSTGSENSPMSPPPLSRKSSSSETAVQQFPLNDIDYESSPAAVAQELNNLQAIRRMSMNVDTADPDLPSFASGVSVPAVPPLPSDEEDDASRLFWVPARLHPELAPKEFKTFVEDRVDRIRQRSGSGDSLSPATIERSGSDGLRRKKSMLSKQIDPSRGYQDGAERLERKRSEDRQGHEHATIENLSELETLVNDPAQAIRKLSLDTGRASLDSGIELVDGDDRPMLPGAGSGLKRSTRTTYRKGSLRRGERVLSSKRVLGRHDSEGEEPPLSPSLPTSHDASSIGQNHLSSTPSITVEMLSQIAGAEREHLAPSVSMDSLDKDVRTPSPPASESQTTFDSPRTQQFQSRIATNGRTTAPIPGVPQIVETPPQAEKRLPNNFTLPERKSSHAPPPPLISSKAAPARPAAVSRPSLSRPTLTRQNQSNNSTLEDISSNPSPLPGSGSTRTDALTMVPTFEDKKAEKKDSLRKTSWNWLMGGEEKEKEKDREKERERQRDKEDRDNLKKPKSMASRLAKSPDKARLDVPQSSIDNNASSRGRESLVLDRDSIRLDEERKKETSRKSGDGSVGKKEKDSGLLSAFFGAGKRSKSSEETTKKKIPNTRTLSPDPSPRILRPDIDYNWTRFSILEERAIYRMAHIKLANPKRALHSQVLLSNFMYSYLAKVQMMHPHMQIPAAQKSVQARNQPPPRNPDRQSEEAGQSSGWKTQHARADAAGGAEQTPESDAHHIPNYTDGSGTQYINNNRHYSNGSASHTTNNTDNNHTYGDPHERDFLGYAKHEQPFEQQSLWDHGDSGKGNDLW